MFDNGFRLLALTIWFTILILHAQCIDTGCNVGSFRLGSKCYDPHLARAATYSNAQEICQENDDQTVVALFENEEITEFLITLGIKYKYQIYAVDHFPNGCSSISWENNFDIEKAICKDNMFVACEFDIQSATILPQNCSSYKNKCYRLLSLRVPASEAKYRCSKIGGRIASLTSGDEKEFFKKLMQEDIWWKKINADAIRHKHFSDFQTFWSGKLSNGECLVQSYNSSSKTDCSAYNHFFCEYKANPDSSTIPHSSTTETIHFTPTMPTSRTFSTTPRVNESTTSILDSTPSTFQSNPNLIQKFQESNATVPQSNPDTAGVLQTYNNVSDSRTLKPFEFAIIGILGGLFILITIVVVHLIKLRKRLFTKHGNKNQGPQSIPLLPSPPTSPTSLLPPPDNDQTQTTDGYLIPNNINTPPSDDTRDGYTPIILHDTNRLDLFVGNETYGNASERSQTGSLSSYNYNQNNHFYEEIIYNRTGY